MKLENNSIYILKLVTGEEIVARVIQHDTEQTWCVIEYPILTVLGPQGLQMMPHLLSADLEKHTRLNMNMVLMVTDPREDVRSSYVQATTGIVPVSKKILTG